MKTTLLLTLLFTAQAHAGFPFVGNHKSNISTKTTLPCTDFTGKWEGTCTYTSPSEVRTGPSEIDIQMWSCSGLEIGKSYYPVNGTKVETDSSKLGTSSSVIALEWNDNAKQEFLNFTSNSKSMFFETSEKYDWDSKGLFRIINGKLHMNQKAANGLSVQCEHTKK